MGKFSLNKALSTKARRTGGGRTVQGYVQTLNETGVANPKMLRQMAKVSFVNSCINLRRAQAAAADWELLPIDDEEGLAPDPVLVDQIRNVLNRPTINGKITSLAGLIGPVIDDMLTLGLGAMIPTYNGEGQVIELSWVDAARVKFIKDWDENSNGPRYILLNKDMKTGKELFNDELITIPLNETTYSNVPISPVEIVYDSLVAFIETRQSVHVLQKNRTPATIVNFDGMTEAHVRRVRRLFERIEGNSTVGFTNHPLQDVKVLQLGSVNIEEQGAPWFVDLIVREVCAAFHVSPMNIHWTQDVNRATANQQLKVTGDQGIEPLMRQIADVINGEVVSTYGGINLHFVWTELLVKDSAQAADVIRKRAGDYIHWPSVNELRLADSLSPITQADLKRAKLDPKLVKWYALPRVMVGPSLLLPPDLAEQMIQSQIAASDPNISNKNQKDILQFQADLQEQAAKNSFKRQQQSASAAHDRSKELMQVQPADDGKDNEEDDSASNKSKKKELDEF